MTATACHCGHGSPGCLRDEDVLSVTTVVITEKSLQSSQERSASVRSATLKCFSLSHLRCGYMLMILTSGLVERRLMLKLTNY